MATSGWTQVKHNRFCSHITAAMWFGPAAGLAERGAAAVAPEAEDDLFTNVGDFWSRYRTARFHDYQNQSSRILADPVRVDRFVRDGDQIDWQGIAIRVVATPGNTRGAVSYMFEVDCKRIACVGHLIYGDGKILDLYIAFKMQFHNSKRMVVTATPLARVTSYSASAKFSRCNPDLLIPARGPVIRGPKEGR
jgi:glyoxylase-like metal-dependent hydrolase (beta-lactamase superfamily II)